MLSHSVNAPESEPGIKTRRGRTSAAVAGWTALRALGVSLLDLVYPPRCASCGEGGSEPFCAVCRDAVDEVPRGCPRCGAPGLPEVCGPCRVHPPAFDSVRAGALFGGPLADAIHAFKYADRPALVRPLARWLAGRVAMPTGAVLVAVPLAHRRRIRRGYDQAEILAGHLARVSGARWLRAALRRVRETPPQVGRAMAERTRNVKDAFEPRRPSSIAGRDVVLVDDVVTTGATADAAAQALRRAGARTVHVVALARAE